MTEVLSASPNDQIEECYRERDHQLIAETKEQTRAFASNGISELGQPVSASRRKLFEQRFTRIDRKGRSRAKAVAQKPKLPRELRKVLYNGGVPRNVGEYRLTRGQRIQLKHNKTRVAAAKLQRQVAAAL